ncbi:hypothetical protein ACTHGU_00135 [Chitinophagaceae bacterium MMS25-I14]
MGNAFYSYLVFIPPDSDADITTLKENLEKFYSKQKNPPIISLADKKLTMTFGDGYHLYVFFSEKEHVIEEAIELAEEVETDFADKPIDKQRLTTCNRRFEVWGDHDYDMDYFNDSLFIIEQLEKFPGVIIIYIS